MDRFEKISKKRWFYPFSYVLLFLISSFVPHYTSTGYSYFEEGGTVIVSVMSVGLEKYQPFAPFFHIATILLLMAVWRLGNKIQRPLSIYFGLNLIFIAIAQCTGHTEQFGFVVMTGTFIVFVLLGLLWISESINPKTDLRFKRLPLYRYWPIPFAMLSFWWPMRMDLQPDFDPILLLTSLYGIGGCATLPIIICLLTIFYPRVNTPIYKFTSFVGVIYGFWNMFSLIRPHTRWLGMLHIPLLLISIYALILPKIVKEESNQEIGFKMC